MPVKSLPSNRSLKHLKCQAKDLLNSLTQGNPEAVARTREFHPKFARMGHESMDSTQVYLHASLELQENALAKTIPFSSQPRRYRHQTNSWSFYRHSDNVELKNGKGVILQKMGNHPFCFHNSA